ncbi:MAG: hypothetical protein K2N51_05645 [Lachnospiraceae bacterium]|nr:hypothetical protein [Lachnospiraceae bacterium]
MKTRLFRVIAVILMLQLVCQNWLGIQWTDTNDRNVNILAKAEETDSLEPKAQKVTIRKRKMTGTVETFMASSSAAQSTVKTKTAFMKKLHNYMNARKTRFSIIFKGNYRKIYNGGDIEKMFAQAWDIDDKKHSNDFDYLHWTIASYGFSIDYYSNNKSVFSFKMSYRESASQLKKVNTKVKKVLASLKLNKKSRVEKIRAIHDYIAKTVQYDHSLKNFTAYAGLVHSNHRTVCQGYALLFYKMCIDAGIPCRIVTGWAGTPHAWNIVKLSGKWYYVDVTWDDTDNTYKPYTYDYFLIGSNKMNWNHSLDSDYKTASFKKRYPISTTNYKWSLPTATPVPTMKPTTTPIITKKPVTTPPVTKTPLVTGTPKITTTPIVIKTPVAAEDNSNRISYIKEASTALKNNWKYDDATKKNQYIYDCYLTTFEKIILQLTEETFIKLKAGILKNDIYSSMDVYWYENLTLPAKEYLQGSEFTTDTERIFQNAYTKAEIEKMTEDEKLKNMENCGNVAFIEKYKTLYNQVAEELINTIVIMLEKE